jgi:hypothetical protein
LLQKAGYDYQTEKARKEAEGASAGEKALSDFTNAPGKGMMVDGAPVNQPPMTMGPMDAEGGIKGIAGA